MPDALHRVLGLAVLTLLATSPSAFGQSRYAPLPSYESVIEQFSAVAFGHEHGSSRAIVQKWSTAPVMAIFTRPGYDVRQHLARIDDLLPEIAELTGLRLAFSQGSEPVTLRVGFYPRSDFTKLPIAQDSEEAQTFLNTSACVAMALNSQEKGGDIGTGAIVIGTDVAKDLQHHCILEEVVQVLGLPADACKYRPSLFCEDDLVDEMTPADKILLRTLYDARIETGARRDDAMPIVRQIIGELYNRSDASREIPQEAPRL